MISISQHFFNIFFNIFPMILIVNHASFWNNVIGACSQSWEEIWRHFTCPKSLQTCQSQAQPAMFWNTIGQTFCSSKSPFYLRKLQKMFWKILQGITWRNQDSHIAHVTCRNGQSLSNAAVTTGTTAKHFSVVPHDWRINPCPRKLFQLTIC